MSLLIVKMESLAKLGIFSRITGRVKMKPCTFVENLDFVISPTTENNGVKVLKVEDDSNLIAGDTIIEVNRERITTVNGFVALVEKIYKTGRNSLLLKIIRDENTLWATIKFKQ